jgi:hypothetical protein
MTPVDPTVHVEAVKRLEKELDEARRLASRALRERREELGITLRKAAPRVRLSPGALSGLETGNSWQTRTAERVARFLASAAA